jgi:signal transduction histidine kinase
LADGAGESAGARALRRMRGIAPFRWFSPVVRSRIFDIALAGFALLAGVAAIITKEPHVHPMAGLFLSLLALAGCTSLLMRRTAPGLITLLIAVIDVVSHLTWKGSGLNSVQMVFALYACGRYLNARRAWQYAVAGVALETASVLFRWDNDLITNLIVSALVVALGQYFRLRAEIAARRRSDAAEAAVRAERRRIARELHDVVAHHISVMSVLVGAARTTMTIDPDRAAEALATTEKTAREALAEMRQLLAVLRAGDGEEGEGAVGARAAQVPELVEAVRRAGVDVRLRRTGEERALPAAVDLAVYRIVQESLTNVRKHAPGASVEVGLDYGRAAIEIEVRDDGGAAPGGSRAAVSQPAPVSGYGLGGMAERVSLVGGRMEAGPLPDQGFRVYAWIPVPVIGMALPGTDSPQ